ncbi:MULTISPECIES: hypothetical protein [Bacillus]|jgi:amino acid permease|uniref:Uncharacterized protein n=2 Tax=Bacillales TaxID=1385 RepID=Q65GC8_BACLD|nr:MULTISPECIES: hypothetical protein [Bacillus]AAU41886.1 hypothetical protein BLi03020 [Bacillus licheniformis DSM 13 = ATCC 14580]ABP97396.1 hypothetical protein BL07049 [Bacillus licheniformis DSM 13 = ATCC 14580]AOP16245.1 hypothetical protein BL1202_03300 [Bacillus licheniformis]ARC64444.1 hypothetical protein B14_01443 [Bacillus licheniformis]EQM26869.1 hypothetical protein N399_16705 [Bacillus licheniformis CG-B52]
MKTFFSAAYCFLMYAFLAYLWLLFITAILDRPRFLNHSLLEAGVILIGTILFFSLSHHFSASPCQNKCQSNRGDRRFLSSDGRSFFYRSVMLTEKRRISDDTRQLRLKKGSR